MEGIAPNAPRLLQPDDDLEAFDCGAPALDDWLKRRAYANHISCASRTYVATVEVRVVAYYCFAAGVVHHRESTGALRRNLPDPLPVMVMGRLAVDRPWQGKGLAAALIRHAIERTHEAARIAGLRALLVHVKTPDLVAFYRHFGFVVSPINPLMLMLRIAIDD